MWEIDEIIMQDLERIYADKKIPWSDLEGKCILVTGATGLIGGAMIDALLYFGLQVDNPPEILALVRNMKKAKKRFGAQIEQCNNLKFVLGNVIDPPSISQPLDFIIHGASQTASNDFVRRPVETIETTLHGTEKMLKLAQNKRIKSMVYLSSVEIYGNQKKGKRITEEISGAIPTQKLRSSYPLSKQMAENWCYSYAIEYQVPVKIARLAQTFGPGVDQLDERVFAEFARCAIEKRDIILKTKGKTERSYLYTVDAVRAILMVLLKGKNGHAYNIANETTYCSIYEMAHLVADIVKESFISVRYEPPEATVSKYLNTHYLDIDTMKLQSLGWNAQYSLYDMYLRMIKSMQ